MVGSFLPGEVAARGGTVVELGAIMLAPLLALLLASLPAQALCRQRGSLAVMRRGLLVGAVLPLLNAVVGERLQGGAFTAWFVAARLTDGLAQALVEVAGITLLLRRSHCCHRVTLSIGLTEAVRSLATVVGPIVGGLAYQGRLTERYTREPLWYAISGLSAPYWLLGLVSLLTALFVTHGIDPAAIDEQRPPAAQGVSSTRAHPLALVRTPGLLLAAALHALSFAAVGLLEACFAPFVLGPPFGASLTWVGTHMTIGSVGLATAALATSSIAAQFGAGQLAQIVAGQLMQAAGLLLLALCVSTGDAALAYTLACCGSGLSLVNSASLMSRLVRTVEEDPRVFAELLAALFLANYAFGYGLSSQAGGVLAPRIGFRATALAYAAVAVSAPLALLLLYPKCLRRRLSPPRELPEAAGKSKPMPAA